MELFRTINIDIDGNRLVLGVDSDSDMPLAPFRQGDIEPVVVTLLKRTTFHPFQNQDGNNPFSRLEVSGLSCEIAIGELDPSAGAGTTPGIYQNSFTPDTNANTLTGTLSIDNTVAASLLDGANDVYVPIYIRIGESGNLKVVYSSTVQIVAKLIPSTTTPPSPIINFPTWAEANGTFVKRYGGDGETFMTVSPDGTKGTIWGTNDDGSPRMDYIDLT